MLFRSKVVDAVNIGGHNYVKLRDLADCNIKVDYDSKERIPIINSGGGCRGEIQSVQIM